MITAFVPIHSFSLNTFIVYLYYPLHFEPLQGHFCMHLFFVHDII